LRDHKDKAEAVQGEEKEVQIRRLRINKKDVEKFGMTPGCDGCRAANRGAPARNHNEECRKRIKGELEKTGDQRVEREQEKLERMEPEGTDDKVGQDTDGDGQQGGERQDMEDDIPSCFEPSEAEDEDIGDEVEVDESDQEDEEARMDTGVMQISGVTFRNEDQNRLDEVRNKVHRKWDDDMNKMKEDMKQYGTEVKFHVTEVYSPPRVNTMAERLGLIPGLPVIWIYRGEIQ
jgi:hypothetical protein